MNINLLKQFIDYTLTTNIDNTYHLTRYYMYNSLKDTLIDYDATDKKCLSISHSNKLCNILGLNKCTIIESNYPQDNILNLKHYENFDFCISDQVLEHVEGDPFVAFQSSVDVLKPGGIVCHTTCFLNEIHDQASMTLEPEKSKDYWRFSIKALELLAIQSDCNILCSHSWGNKDARFLIDNGYRFAKIPDDINHPMNKIAMDNDLRFPIHTWIVAQKNLKEPESE
jgi:SAM-dependent methyltransferase